MNNAEAMDRWIARFFFNHGIDDLLPSGKAETVSCGVLDASVMCVPHRLFCFFVQCQVIVGVSDYAVRLKQNVHSVNSKLFKLQKKLVFSSS